MNKRIGVFGGSFDPPHKIHIELVEKAYDFLCLDEIFFVPAKVSPLKDGLHCASPYHRLNMLKIALKNFDKKYSIKTLELEREGKSFSYDTAKKFSEEYKDTNFFWILGSDQLQILGKWYKIDELSKLVKFGVAERPNYSSKIELPINIEIIKIPFEKSDVSSTKIRKELKNNLKYFEYLNEDVIEYINKNNLYT